MDEGRSWQRAARWLRSPGGFVWFIWLALSAAALWLVAAYGVDLPRYDEWAIVELATRRTPVTWEELWRLHNEHRIVLPRLIYVGALRATGDFRAIQVINVLCAVVASALFIDTARVLRGSVRRLDVLPALLLLHFGHHDAWMHGFNLQFALTVLFLAGVARVVAGPPRIWRVAVVGTLTVGLALSGANGMVFVPGLALYSSLALRACSGHPLARGLSLVPALVAVVLVVVAAATFEPHDAYPYAEHITGRLSDALRTAAQLGANAWGPTGVLLSPWPALVSYPVMGVAIVRSVAAARGAESEARTRALAHLALLLGAVVLMAAIAWARASTVDLDEGLATRHTLLLAGLMVLAYLALVREGRRAHPAAWTLAVAALVFLAGNQPLGLSRSASIAEPLRRASEAARAGMEPARLAEEHGAALAMWEVEPGIRQLGYLRVADMGPYGRRAWPEEVVFRDPPASAYIGPGSVRRRCGAEWVRAAQTPDEVRFPVPRGAWELEVQTGPCWSETTTRFTFALAPDRALHTAELIKPTSLFVWFDAPGRATAQLLSSTEDSAAAAWTAIWGVGLRAQPSLRVIGDAVRSVSSRRPIRANTCGALEENHVGLHPPAELRVVVPEGRSTVTVRAALCPDAERNEETGSQVVARGPEPEHVELAATAWVGPDAGFEDWSFSTDMGQATEIILEVTHLGFPMQSRLLVARVAVVPDTP